MEILGLHSSDETHFDVVVVGSGFGSLFFLERYFARRPGSKVLILERGGYWSHEWQLEHMQNSPIPAEATFRGLEGQKPWKFTIGLGGGLNCWYATTPRLHPHDFQLRSRYGVGRDWPVSYDELEPYYTAAERRMSISGGEQMARILPRSEPFPQPPHRGSAIDRVMQQAQPEYHFPVATARARVPTETRNMCCASFRCNLCPVDAKFTAENGFQDLFARPGLSVELDAEVTHLDHEGTNVTAGVYQKQGRERRVTGDLFVLGANAIHSPAILLRSGIDHPLTGCGLHEQVGYAIEVLLDGLDNFGGSTITTGLNYSLYDTPSRRDRGGALIFFENRWQHNLRKEFGRWRQTLPLLVSVEDLPQDANRVTVDSDGRALVDHRGASDYGMRGVAASRRELERLLAPLPVEEIVFRGMRETEAHLQGTLRMGHDSETSVIDGDQIHHDLHNLVIVGSSVFPTCACANPSLTVAALSLRAAERITG
jgi:choline dehydrogenase-like flavoprotein